MERWYSVVSRINKQWLTELLCRPTVPGRESSDDFTPLLHHRRVMSPVGHHLSGRLPVGRRGEAACAGQKPNLKQHADQLLCQLLCYSTYRRHNQPNLSDTSGIMAIHSDLTHNTKTVGTYGTLRPLENACERFKSPCLCWNTSLKMYCTVKIWLVNKLACVNN